MRRLTGYSPCGGACKLRQSLLSEVLGTVRAGALPATAVPDTVAVERRRP